MPWLAEGKFEVRADASHPILVREAWLQSWCLTSVPAKADMI